MPNPCSDLIADLQTAFGSNGDIPTDLSFYEAPQEQIKAPAIVFRPNAQWMGRATFCHELERYDAIAVVTANSPIDGIALLRTLSLAIIGSLPKPWDWEGVDGPVVDQSTGVPFLANRIRLKYPNSGDGGS